jgi:glycerophosphoryl diester phosphodiesterase
MPRSNRARLARLVLAGAALLVVLAPAAASAKTKGPIVWAHRGGSYVNGKATYPENTLPGFTAAAKHGFVLELDIQQSKDGVPFVLHDSGTADALDRTTVCTGSAEARTWAELKQCPSDVLGSPEADPPLGPKAKTTTKLTPLPKFSDVLKIAKKYHVTIAPELKVADTDGHHAKAMAAAIKASKIPLKQVVVQSFIPTSITQIKSYLPKVATSQLTLAAINTTAASSIGVATSDHASWVSPQFTDWVNASYVKQAHAAGLKVAVYTPDTKAEVRRAKKIGADALITNDPYMAKKALAKK